MSQNTTESEVLVKLVYAAESGDLSLLRTLLTDHHDLALHGDYSFAVPESRTLLHKACIAGEHECVVELLKAGANPNAVDENHRVLRARQGRGVGSGGRVAREYVYTASFSGSGDT